MQEPNKREREAADAYLAFLQGKGAPSHMLYLRSKFLDSFITKLTGKMQTRKAFAYALEDTLKNTAKDERSLALSTAREFFPFWMNDIKAIAMFQEYYGFSTDEKIWEPKHKTLSALSKALDTLTLTEAEMHSLLAYIAAIKKLGADRQVVEARSKLVKIILIRLREAPTSNHASYRIAVDLTLPLFKSREIKALYLDVVREFFYFWQNDPDAEVKVFGAD